MAIQLNLFVVLNLLSTPYPISIPRRHRRPSRPKGGGVGGTGLLALYKTAPYRWEREGLYPS